MTKKRVKRYEGDAITVEFDLPRCIHAAECGKGLPTVFDSERRPWVDPGAEDPGTIAGVVSRCPTGALSYQLPDGTGEAPDAENTIRVIPDGPLHVRGRIRLKHADGSVTEETRVALCRCGLSKNKPLCDNAHVEGSFSDTAESVPPMLGAGGGGGPGDPVSLSPAINGPVLVKGPVAISGAGGESVNGAKGALCRCGASTTKPFCDATHVANGYEAE
jgi:CDGSH-type Zn-finger protein/uncharacterized Fe-S cluster protein YjdI